MTSCQLFAADLEALHDAELPRDRAAAVRRHAATCPACSVELERLRSIASVLRARSEPASPGDLWSDLEPRLAAVDAAIPRAAQTGVVRSPVQRPSRRRALRAGRPLTGWRRALPPLAAAASLAGLGLFIVGRTPPAQALNVVRSLDTYGAPVLVMPDDADGATVIWLLDEPGAAADGAAGDRHVPEP